MELLRSTRQGTVQGRITTRDPNWITPARGIRVHSKAKLSHDLLARGLIASVNRLAVACDLTAAHLWSMTVPSGFGLDVDAQPVAIATIRDGNRLQSGGTRGRRLELPPDHITTLDGIAITTPARTWLDCAALVRWADTVAMGDALLRAEQATRDELAAMVVWGRGRRGVRAARWALPLLDPRSESPAESWVRAYLLYAGVPAPRCNHEVQVFGYDFRLDLAWVDERIALEYDGVDYHGPDREDRDAWRRELLRHAGWTVLVVRREDLTPPHTFVTTIRDLLNQKPTWRPRSHSRAR